jgi:chromosome segregation ATPase
MMFHATKEPPFASSGSIASTSPVTSNDPIQQFRGDLQKALTQLEASLLSNETGGSTKKLEVMREEWEAMREDLEATNEDMDFNVALIEKLKSKCSALEEENRALRESGEKLRQMRELLGPSSK